MSDLRNDPKFQKLSSELLVLHDYYLKYLYLTSFNYLEAERTRVRDKFPK